MNQQVAISGLGGQGVLFITRLLAEAALVMGRDILSSETHGMAMRGGAVVSHLKVGDYKSPLIRSGAADVAVYLAEENLEVHPQLIGAETKVLINSGKPGDYMGLDASVLAEKELGSRRAANLVLLGYGLGKGLFFADVETVRRTLPTLSRTDDILAANEKALNVGLSRSSE